MAGYRLAPKAARARRNPWQRRRLGSPSAPANLNRTASDSFALDDYNWNLGYPTVTIVVSYHKTVSDGFTIADSVAGAAPSTGTASGGLIFLFSQGTVGSSYTRSASDGFTISDSASRSLVPVATSSYSRTCTDGFVFVDVASGSVVAGSSTPSLIGVSLDFTAVLDVELSFVGE